MLMLDHPHLSWQIGVAGQSDVVDENGQTSPVIGWNDLHILYQLPDGSMWAEHGNLFDSEDLVSCHWLLTLCVHNLSASLKVSAKYSAATFECTWNSYSQLKSWLVTL